MNAELTFLTALQSLHSPMLDESMGFITRLGDSGILWVTLTALLLVFRKTRRVGCVLAVALLIDAVLCNLLLKPLVARVRPCDILTEVQLLIPHPDDFSFPSGHTAASFASVTALWLAGKKQWAMAALPVGVLIAFSRMYGNEVWLYETVGGKHSWKETGVDTGEELWKFFSRYVR